ncbi:hypothetical protein QUA86_02335 [Microcoleus sp. F6_B6]
MSKGNNVYGNLYQLLSGFLLNHLFRNGQDARPTKIKFSCAIGISIVLQKLNLLVERARCPFFKNSTFLWNGHLARS